MSDSDQPQCTSPEQAEFDTQRAAEDTWEALLSAGVFVEGDFTFASGKRASLKADAEKLYAHPRQLGVVLGHFATYPCVQDADVLLYVPDGMRQFVTQLGSELDKPVVGANRKLGATSKYDFVFASEADRKLAQSAKAPVIGEDIVTTLGSVAGIRKLLKPDQTVHSLAMLLRGTVNPVYQKGLVDHYLLVKEIPTSKDEFWRMLEED